MIKQCTVCCLRGVDEKNLNKGQDYNLDFNVGSSYPEFENLLHTCNY